MDNQKNNLSGNNFELDKNSELDVLFKKALQNHAVPTEDHVWRRIQHGLVDKKLADKKGETSAPITKSITKRSSLPIWSALSGIAASFLIWALFFAPSNSTDLENNPNTIANSDKIEIVDELNKTENTIPVLVDNSQNNSENKEANNKEKNQNTDATSLQVIASKKQQIPPTITIKNTPSKNKIKTIDINEAVASLEKDQTKNKNSQDKVGDKTSMTPSTHISDNVWASDFVVHNPTISIKKAKNNADIYQLNLDNQSVAITIKVGKNENFDTSQATGFDANTNSSQFDKAKNVLKEVWNLKTGKKVNLQNILPNNENEKASDKTITNPSNQNNEIQAD